MSIMHISPIDLSIFYVKDQEIFYSFSLITMFFKNFVFEIWIFEKVQKHTCFTESQLNYKINRNSAYLKWFLKQGRIYFNTQISLFSKFLEILMLILTFEPPKWTGSNYTYK